MAQNFLQKIKRKAMYKNKNVDIAQAYYMAMAEKDGAEIENYLHPEVCLISPFGETIGKEAVLDSAKKFMHMFKTIDIRAKFDSEEQAVLVYDLLDFAAPGNTLRAVSLLTFKDGLIIQNELFFDTRSAS